MKQKTKSKQNTEREWRLVSLTIVGKYLNPKKVAEALDVLPDKWGKLGVPYRNNRKSKQGFWALRGGPTTWRIETQMKNILKRISPVKSQLRELIKEDETVERAYLTIAFAPSTGIANACYCFDAELVNEFTSMGIDIALSIQIRREWEEIFKGSDGK